MAFLNVLGQVAGPEPLDDPHFSLVRGDFALEHPEEGGLSGTVRAHKTDPVRGLYLESDVAENLPA